MDPKEFLTELWGDPPPGPVLVWALPDKDSSWYADFKSVCQDLAARPDDDNYTGVGIPRTDPPMATKLRGKADQVTAIAGMWADIDVKHPIHKKDNLTPTTEKAIETLDALPFSPTIIVNSGHGIQAWWLFDTPWIFQSDEDRDMAQTMSQWWYEQIKALYATEGWVADPVWNIDQVMRIPGTTNNKDKREPVPVTVIESGGHRFNRHEFADLIPTDFHPVINVSRNRVTKKVNGNGLVLNADASPPPIKFMTLSDLNPKFRRTWKSDRPDLPDQSPSAYDMSLAMLALSAEWSDQETVDLLIAWRREHGHDLKLREHYYATTISKARHPMEILEAQENLTEAIYTQSQDKPKIIRESLSTIFGVGITKIIKFTGDPPTYRMITDKGDITLGPVSNLTHQAKFRDLAAAATGVLIPKCNPQIWETRAQALLDACEEMDVGEASDPIEETMDWLDNYLSERTISDDQDLEQAAATKQPFLMNSATHIFINDFRKWVEHTTGSPMNNHSMGQRLRLCHAQLERINVTIAGRRSTRSCWRLEPK